MFALKYFNRRTQEWMLSSHSINLSNETAAGMVDYYRRNGGNSAVYGLVVSDEPGQLMVHVPTGIFPDFEAIRTYDGGVFAPTLNDLITLEAYLEATRPQPPTPAAAVQPGDPAPAPTEASMVTLDIKRGTVDGKNHGSALMLIIDAKPLHDLLDLMGCEVAGDTYRNGPSFGGRVVDSADNLAPGLFLRRVYPLKVNLSEVYSTPPTLSRLRHLAESANSAIQKILEHYRPIDIKVTIAKQPAA